MQITCPHCNFSGTIQDGLIPESGSAVNCPKCRKKFFVAPDIPEMEADDSMASNIPSAPEGDDKPSKKTAPKQKGSKGDTVKTLFVAFGLIFGMFLCFIAGRISVGSNPLDVPAKPAGTGPAAPTKTTEAPSVAGGLPTDLPVIVLPGERFVGAETVDIVVVDKNLSDISALADAEKAAKMRELAEGLVGKNVKGTYQVKRFETVMFFFDALLPKGAESRYLEAEADTKSPVHARIFLTMSGKGPEITAMEMAKKVFVVGLVVSCRSLGGLELGLTNAEVKPAR